MAPIATLYSSKSDIFAVQSVAVDSKGNIYVANGATCYYFCPNTEHITVYPPGSKGDAAPSATINGVTGYLAIGPDDDLYVASGDMIEVFASGASGDASPVATIAGPDTGLGTPSALAVSSTGAIYVANTDPRRKSARCVVSGCGRSLTL